MSDDTSVKINQLEPGCSAAYLFAGIERTFYYSRDHPSSYSRTNPILRGLGFLEAIIINRLMSVIMFTFV